MEAQAEGDTGDESREEEQEDDQGGQFLVPDYMVECSSPFEHRRVDANLREQDAESPVIFHLPLPLAMTGPCNSISTYFFGIVCPC